mgnify:CR=1 FL=1
MGFKRVNTVKIVSIICAIVFFVLSIILIIEFVNIANLKQKEKQLNLRLQEVTSSISETTKQANYLNSNEYLEDYARENLGWGKNGEVIYK